jgi:hypothetical protein
MGRLLAERDAADRRERPAQREADRLALAVTDALAVRIRGVCAVLTLAAEGMLLAAGFRRHNRQWRQGKRIMAIPSVYLSRRLGDGQVRVLAEKASNGDDDARRALKKLLADDPALFAQVGGGTLPQGPSQTPLA